MMNASKRIRCVVAVMLGMGVLRVMATAQVIEWERFYSQRDTVEGSGGYYSGRHILPLSGGGYVVTSVTGSGATVAVARFDSEGARLWEHGITERDTSIYGMGFGHEGEQVILSPRFSYVREDRRVVVFTGEEGTPGFSRGYGVCYQLVLDEDSGKPLDTVVRWDSSVSLSRGSAVCRMRDGRFVDARVWPYSLESDTLGMVYLKRFTSRGNNEVPYWFRWYSVGERETGDEIYHYPWRVIQTPDNGFVVYGVRAVIGGPSTLFLLKVDSLGGKVWEGQTKPEEMGGLGGAFFDTTADGGFILLGNVSYQDTGAERKRWRVMRLVKFSPGGVEEWSRDYQSERDYTTGKSVRQTADGGFLLLGTVGGFNETYSTYLASEEDAFLLKTDGVGREEWRKQWGDSARQDMAYMLLQPDGSAIVTGSATKGEVWNGLYLAKIRIGTAGVASGEEPAGTFAVIPNPARDRLRVVGSSPLIGRETSVRLFDLVGRDVLGGSVPFGSSGVAEIDVSDLSVGTYRAVVEGREGEVLAVRPVMIAR